MQDVPQRISINACMPEGQGVGSHSWLYAENSKPVLEIQSTCITNSKLVLPFKMRSDYIKFNSS